jgi:DNA-directed RNA polymerase subunit RPC12/RpoP
MDIEIRIGRTVDGLNAIRVPATCQKVSRNHAIIRWRDGSVTIDDNGSSNGTFVNGQRVTSAVITENDTVTLGGFANDPQGYRVDLRSVFAMFPNVRTAANAYGTPSPYGNQMSYNAPSSYGNPAQGQATDPNRTDYSADFPRLKQAYIEYHEQMSKLKKKASNKMLLPRILISAVPALLGAVVYFLSKDMTMRIVAMSAGPVLSGLLGTLIMGRGSSSTEKMNEKILDLQLKYQKEYKCPKCGKEYSMDLHWKKLQAEGKCPYGCGARFS